MENLKSILQRAHDRQLKAGGVVSKQLIEDLRGYRKQQFVMFAILELLIVLGVSFCAYYLSVHPGNATQVKTLASLIGLGSGGGIEIMRRIWRGWSESTLLLLMLPEASQAQVTDLIDRLIKRL